jgi:hypothetical protein
MEKKSIPKSTASANLLPNAIRTASAATSHMPSLSSFRARYKNKIPIYHNQNDDLKKTI